MQLNVFEGKGERGSEKKCTSVLGRTGWVTVIYVPYI